MTSVKPDYMTRLFLKRAIKEDTTIIRKNSGRKDRSLDIKRELSVITGLNPRRGDIKNEQKRLARIYLQEAIKLYQAMILKPQREFLREVISLFKSRIKEIRRILDNHEKGLIQVVRTQAKAAN